MVAGTTLRAQSDCGVDSSRHCCSAHSCSCGATHEASAWSTNGTPYVDLAHVIGLRDAARTFAQRLNLAKFRVPAGHFEAHMVCPSTSGQGSYVDLRAAAEARAPVRIQPVHERFTAGHHTLPEDAILATLDSALGRVRAPTHTRIASAVQFGRQRARARCKYPGASMQHALAPRSSIVPSSARPPAPTRCCVTRPGFCRGRIRCVGSHQQSQPQLPRRNPQHKLRR